jgi:hypothetical protein
MGGVVVMATEADLRDALEDCALQFAIRTIVDGKPALTPGGLSALEYAFVVLGWSDPHFVEAAGGDREPPKNRPPAP